MKKSRRMGALLLLFGFVTVLFLSSAYMLHEADHDCCGHDCPVCARIARMAALMESFALAGAAYALCSGLRQSVSRRRRAEGSRAFGLCTPVTRKVRLNN